MYLLVSCSLNLIENSIILHYVKGLNYFYNLSQHNIQIKIENLFLIITDLANNLFYQDSFLTSTFKKVLNVFTAML